MIKTILNRDWKFVKGSAPSLRALQMYGKEAETVSLPHDAMIHETPCETTKNGGATGFYPGGVYTYFKTLFAPEEWREKTVTLEFEGVYEKAMVYVNGALAAVNSYGYSDFYVSLDRYLQYGEENEIKVIADNGSEQNSRWYSGSGIYRSVNLFVGNLVQIPVNGVQAATLDADEAVAVVEIATQVSNLTRKKETLEVLVELTDSEGKSFSDRVRLTAFGNSDYRVRQSLTIRKPRLWDCDSPELYQCSVKLFAGETVLDESTFPFGIRKLSLDAARGLRINGKPVKLRGTCVHHDNGILGAAAYEEAEYRKCRLLKEAGFNSIRSAHHPAGKALLSACDRLGLLVIDELCDMWTVHKNDHDFAFSFLDEWKHIADAMIAKDYNHPCVILYSVGNEISEVGTERGAEINRMLCNYFREKDGLRYTTNGMNALNAAGARMFPIMQELAPLLRKEEHGGTNDNSGSNAINSFMGLMEGEAGEAFAKHPLITETLRESSGSMDIIGLNYLTGRHLEDVERYPNKCVVGTETFPADIARLWKTVNASPQILGDFTWTGYDYLGEAGCGIFYYDEKANFGSHFPDRLAYIGDIDLAGCRRPISFLREIVYGLRSEPYIAVERVDRYGMLHSKTPWMLKDNIASWTWHGFEGTPAVIDVYSGEEEVELFLNGVSLGRKPAGREHGFVATFRHAYEPGALTAVGYRDGEPVGSFALATCGKEVHLSAETSKQEVHAGSEELAFVSIRLTDENGKEILTEKRRITAAVEGSIELLAMGSADPQPVTSYDSQTWETYHGGLLVVVRAKGLPGAGKLVISVEGEAEKTEVGFQVI